MRPNTLDTQHSTQAKDWDGDTCSNQRRTLPFWKGSVYILSYFLHFSLLLSIFPSFFPSHFGVTLRCPDDGNYLQETKFYLDCWTPTNLDSNMCPQVLIFPNNVSFMCTICFSFTSTCGFLLLFLCAVMTFFLLKGQKTYLFRVYWKLHSSLKYFHICFELARTFVIFQISDPLKDALYTCKYAQTIIWMVSWVTYAFSLFIYIPLALLDKGFVEGEMNYV